MFAKPIHGLASDVFVPSAIIDVVSIGLLSTYESFIQVPSDLNLKIIG